MKRLPNTERRRRCVYHSVGVHCVDSVACVCSTLQLLFLYAGKNQSSSRCRRARVPFFCTSQRLCERAATPDPPPRTRTHCLRRRRRLFFSRLSARQTKRRLLRRFSGSSSPRCRCEWRQSTGFLHSQHSQIKNNTNNDNAEASSSRSVREAFLILKKHICVNVQILTQQKTNVNRRNRVQKNVFFIKC